MGSLPGRGALAGLHAVRARRAHGQRKASRIARIGGASERGGTGIPDQGAGLSNKAGGRFGERRLTAQSFQPPPSVADARAGSPAIGADGAQLQNPLPTAEAQP
jgi:hypothetical protein